jgi:PadR family transcriptional regulator, regulatory protein PadR
MTAIDTKVALLSALVSGEGYGLEIIDRVHDLTNGEIRLVQGRVYPALRELEDEGFLESYDGPPLPERGGRPRRYYKLTAEGRKAARVQAKAIAGLLRPVLGVV